MLITHHLPYSAFYLLAEDLRRRSGNLLGKRPPEPN
jgi:hypothetical protein